MGINDRGRRGLEVVGQPIKVGAGSSGIEPLGSVVFFDDFLGDTLNTDVQVITNTVGGTTAISSTAGDPVPAHGGWIVQTVTADADATELGVMKATTIGDFRPSRAGSGVMVFQCRFSTQELTTKWINMGFTDDETEGAAIAMSLSTTTWTTAATDAALAGFYSTATDNDNIIFQSVKADVDGTHVASTAPLTVNTARVVRIEVNADGNAAWYDGEGSDVVFPAYQGLTAGAVTATRTYIPYVALAGTAAATVTNEIDYVFASCAR